MKAIVKRPGEQAKVIDVLNDMEVLQAFVGKDVRPVYARGKDIILCDGEANWKLSPWNCRIEDTKFRGTILIVSQKGADFTDIRDPDYWLDYLDAKEHML